MAQDSAKSRVSALDKLDNYLHGQARTSHGTSVDHHRDVEAALHHLLAAMPSERDVEVRDRIMRLVYDHAPALDAQARARLESAAATALSTEPPTPSLARARAGKGGLMRKLRTAKKSSPYLPASSKADHRHSLRSAWPNVDHAFDGLPATGIHENPSALRRDSTSTLSSFADSTSETSSQPSTRASSLFDDMSDTTSLISSVQSRRSSISLAAAMHDSGANGIPSDPDHYDALLQELVREHGWSSADIDKLGNRIEQSRTRPMRQGTMRNIAANEQARHTSMLAYRSEYLRIPGFSDDDKWMRRMGAAINRRKAGASSERPLATRAAEDDMSIALRQSRESAAAEDERLRLQEEEDLQKALLASRSNHLDNYYADAADGVAKFRNRMAELGVEIVPNEGDRHDNTCFLIAVEQQITGKHGGQEAIERARQNKFDMAQKFPHEVEFGGLVDPSSDRHSIQWLRQRMFEQHGMLVDPFIVHTDASGNPVLAESRDPLPGYIPVLIANPAGAHFEAMRFTASNGSPADRHWEAFHMIKAMSDSRLEQ
jgi:hypothetical protein